MGTQGRVVQARGRVFPADPPEGLRRSLADAPQKFEQVDGGAEPAVAVDQGPEKQRPNRGHQAGQAIPEPRHRAAAATGPTARRRHWSEALSPVARQACRPRVRPLSLAPRTPPRQPPGGRAQPAGRVSAAGSRTHRASSGAAALRLRGPPRTRQRRKPGLPPQGEIPSPNCEEMKARFSNPSSYRRGKRQSCFDRCSNPLVHSGWNFIRTIKLWAVERRGE